MPHKSVRLPEEAKDTKLQTPVQKHFRKSFSLEVHSLLHKPQVFLMHVFKGQQIKYLLSQILFISESRHDGARISNNELLPGKASHTPMQDGAWTGNAHPHATGLKKKVYFQ